MASRPPSERSWLILAVIVLVAVVFLTRLSHRLTRSGSAPTPSAAQPSLIPVPSDPPTPAAIAELQARNPGLHWASVDPRTAMIVTPEGACGTLTGLSPTQINFHTGRDYDRAPHLFSSWSDAYAAAEQYCVTWAAAQKAHPPAPR